MPAALRLVIGGSLMVTTAPSRPFALESKDFALGFLLADTGSFSIQSHVVAPGDSVNPSGTLAGDQTLHQGVVDYRGVVYPLLWYTGTLAFTATPFTAPAANASILHITTPFTLDGDVQAYHNNPFIGNPGPSVLDFRVRGKGRVTTRLSGAGANGLRQVTSYFFSFR